MLPKFHLQTDTLILFYFRYGIDIIRLVHSTIRHSTHQIPSHLLPSFKTALPLALPASQIISMLIELFVMKSNECHSMACCKIVNK